MRKPVCHMGTTKAQISLRIPAQYNTSSFYIRNFKPLPSFCGCAGWFESSWFEQVVAPTTSSQACQEQLIEAAKMVAMSVEGVVDMAVVASQVG